MVCLNRRATLGFSVLLLGPLGLSAGAVAEEEGGSKKPKLNFITLGDFTVNLPDDGGSLSYVVIAITIEAAPDAAADLKDMMPRLKEAVTRRLMAMAEHGGLKAAEIDPLMLKTSLLDSLSKVRPGGGVNDVLITRLLYG